MAKLLQNNGLTIALMLMFALSLCGHWLAGWRVENQELAEHGRAGIGLLAYLSNAEFLSTLFENWESEFLQMAVYVVLTAKLIQRGSAESRDPDAPGEVLPTDDPRAPRGARLGGWLGWLYAHSLGTALIGLFLASFVLHWTFSASAANEAARLHGAPTQSLLDYVADPQLWFESFQNWQSEFLSTAVLVVLSIFLRQQNSPESKRVSSPNSATGA